MVNYQHVNLIVDPGASNPKGVAKFLWDTLCTLGPTNKICQENTPQGAAIRLIMQQLTYLLGYDEVTATSSFGEDLEKVKGMVLLEKPV